MNINSVSTASAAPVKAPEHASARPQAPEIRTEPYAKDATPMRFPWLSFEQQLAQSSETRKTFPDAPVLGDNVDAKV